MKAFPTFFYQGTISSKRGTIKVPLFIFETSFSQECFFRQYFFQVLFSKYPFFQLHLFIFKYSLYLCCIYHNSSNYIVFSLLDLDSLIIFILPRSYFFIPYYIFNLPRFNLGIILINSNYLLHKRFCFIHSIINMVYSIFKYTGTIVAPINMQHENYLIPIKYCIN